MGFEYHWKNNEANFGPPQEDQIEGGTHVTFEVIPKYNGKYVALRRPNGIPEHELPPHASEHPKGLLYFCHNLIRYGESLEKCISRIVRDQTGVGVKHLRVVHLYSEVQDKDSNWSINPVVIVEVDQLPATNNQVTEVVTFNRNNAPDDFGWWERIELEDFLARYDT